MSISSDGATVRRERILDMLRYIRSFSPKGLSMNQVNLYMSMVHGLTHKTSTRYVYEMQQGQVLSFQGGMLQVNASNFRRLMELMAPDRDPDTGEFLSSLGFTLEDIPDPEKEEGKDP